MTDRVSPEVRSRIMSRIRSTNTTPELLVFRALRRERIYFQRHYRKALGTPDIALPRKRAAVFIDGDFWHGYRFPAWRDRLSSQFWIRKIERNRARDRRTFRMLRSNGWRLLRIWEHELAKDNYERTIDRIKSFLRGA